MTLKLGTDGSGTRYLGLGFWKCNGEITIARLRRKPMVKNGDYFLNYKSYSKSFDVNLKLLSVI